MSGESQTIGDFTFWRPSKIYRISATILSLILPMNLAGNGKCAKTWNLRDKGPGAQQFMGLVMSEIHRRCPLRCSQIFQFSFVGNDRRPSQKSGTRWENRNALESPDLSPSIPDDRGYLRFRVFISRQIWDSRKAVKSPIVWDFPDIWKPGLQKKKLCTWSTLFISLPLFCTTTTRETSENRLTYTFQGRNVVRFLVHFFFLCLSFSPWIGGR